MFSFLIKRIILLYIMLYIPQSVAKFVPISNTPVHTNSEIKNIFKNNDEKSSYALGVSLGNYVNQSFDKQQKIGVNLDKYNLLQGIKDSILGNIKLSSEEISLCLKDLEKKLTNAKKNQFESNIKENFINGKLYMNNLCKEDGVNKTSSGLLYVIEDKGRGDALTNNSKITVHYKGTLINGFEFDNSYLRGKPITLMLKDVILGWQEGLKYIRKGGKIKLIIPPDLAYGEKGVTGIPGNSTLIFNIELLDVVNTA